MYALSAHLTRRLLPGMSSVAIAAGSLIASVVLLALPAILLLPPAMPSARAWANTAALAVFATGGAYVLYFRLLERIGVTGAIAVTYLIPLFGMVWGRIFLGERVTPTMAFGCVLILAGVAVTTGATGMLARSRRRPPSPSSDSPYPRTPSSP
jgi:drug/metabolite transporter (DMT)-like permease